MKQNQFNHGLYPGSFDPFTNGHRDIICRMSALFEKVTVLISFSSEKSYWFSLQERQDMVASSVASLSNVVVDSFEGLTVHYARKHGISTMVRGIRSDKDFSYEKNLAFINKQLHDKIETLFMLSTPGLEILSSKFIKELACHGASLENFIPSTLHKKIQDRAKEKQGVL